MIAGGGNTGSGSYAEMFIPSTGEHCHLPAIPGPIRDAHSTSGATICGGYYSKHTCITLIGNSVSLANCSLINLVGLGVWLKTVFNSSNCFALMVVLGPLSFSSFLVSLWLWLSPTSGVGQLANWHRFQRCWRWIGTETVQILFQ